MAKRKKTEETEQMIKMKAAEKLRNFHTLKKDWKHPAGRIKPAGTRLDLTQELEKELRAGKYI